MNNTNKKIYYYKKIRNKLDELANNEFQVIMFYHLTQQSKNLKLINHRISYSFFDKTSKFADKRINTLQKQIKKV